MEKGGVPFRNSALSSILHKSAAEPVHASGQAELGSTRSAYHSRAREEAPPVVGEAEASPTVCLWRRS